KAVWNGIGVNAGDSKLLLLGITYYCWLPKRKNTEVPQPSGPTSYVVDKAINEEMDDSLERAATTATSLDVEQDSGNINKTQSKATLNEPSSIGTSSGSGPRRLETMRDTIAQTRSENVSKLSNDSLLTRVLALETTKTTQVRAESSRDEEDLGEDTSKQGRRIHNIDADEDITLVNYDNEMFDMDALAGEELFVAEQSENVDEEVVDAAQTATITDVEITLAQTLAELKSAKPKANRVVIQELEQDPTTTTIAATTITAASTRHGDKGIVIHEQEQAPTPTVSSQQPSQVKAKIEVNYLLAQRLQAQEQEELTDEENARLFVQFLEERRKHFASKRAEEKRNKPPTRAQQRSIMCTYLKNIEGLKPKNLKNKSFANIQDLFDKAMKRVNTFVDYRTELVEEGSKKAETEQEENSKKAEHKVEEDKESEDLKQCLEIVPDDGDDVTIDATPLSIKSPTIEIQVLYERYKKQDQTFVAIGSEEDERAIKKMNEQAADKEKEQKAESVHEEVKEEEGAKKRKLGTRRKLKAKRRTHIHL
ncbi:hypothetical protein Tco_1040769, partial [Tanacetum coccineum]